MKAHREVLELAANGALPSTVDGSAPFGLDVFRELRDAGLIDAIDASSHDGYAYLQPRITLAGRQYLSELSSGSSRPNWWQRHGTQLVIGVLVIVIGGLILAAIL